MTVKINGTNTAAAPGVTGSDTDTGLVYGTDQVDISTGGTARARVDSSGRLLLGTTTSRSSAAGEHRLQVENTNTEGLSLSRTSADAGGINVSFIKTRNGAVVQSGDDCGAINWFGDDGTDTNSYLARIVAKVDGTPGSNDMPGRLSFQTTSDGGHTTTERMRIDSSGNVTKPNSSKFSTQITYVNEFKGGGTVMGHATPHLDDGNDFDATNNRFVAPVDGAYYFSWHVNVDMNTGGRSEFHFIFRKNGTSVDGTIGGRAYGEWTGNGWEHIHMSMMMNLSASDYVDVVTGRSNMRVDGGGYGQFTGFLVG